MRITPKQMAGVTGLAVGVLMLVVLTGCTTQSDINEANKQEEINIRNCMSNVETAYRKGWNDYCKYLGYQNDCGLPHSVAKDMDQARDNDLNRCIRIYEH